MKSKYYSVASCIFIFALIACNQNKPKKPKGFEKLDAPKEAYSELKTPAPVRDSQNLLAAKFQPGKHGFEFLVSGHPFTDSIMTNITGDVVSASKNEIRLHSNRGEVTMRYSLPNDISIPVQQGQSLNINYHRQFFENSIGFTVVNSSKEDLLHASARLSADKPIDVPIFKGLSIRQTDKTTDEKKSDYGTMRQVQTVLNVSGRNVEIVPGKIREIDFNGVKLSVIVLASVENKLGDEKKSSSEGEGFTLEYAIVRR
jgi:hypothetical protein